MGPVSLNLSKTSTLSVAGGNSGVASANIATTGVDIVGVSQATTGTTYVYVCNTGTTAILVQSAAADGSTFTTIGSIGAAEFWVLPIFCCYYCKLQDQIRDCIRYIYFVLMQYSRWHNN